MAEGCLYPAVIKYESVASSGNSFTAAASWPLTIVSVALAFGLVAAQGC